MERTYLTLTIDVTDEEVINIIFKNYKIDEVIHFAGIKAVGESVVKPLAGDGQLGGIDETSRLECKRLYRV